MHKYILTLIHSLTRKLMQFTAEQHIAHVRFRWKCGQRTHKHAEKERDREREKEMMEKSARSRIDLHLNLIT